MSDWTCVHSLTLNARAGQLVAVDDLGLQPGVRDYLRRSFPDGIYRHQHDAIEALLSGSDVCLATTTASGKTLAFTVSALERIENDPRARVLALYPQRALAAEQEERWRRAMENAGQPPHVCRIDGSVTSANRAALLRSARVVVATPDVLHSWFLSNSGDRTVRDFLRGVSLIVVDEVHTYTGVFGSNSAFLFRRLQHAIAQLGASVRFFCASATIREPAQHLEKLFGRPFVVVGPERDSAPRQSVRVEFLRPPPGTDFLGALTDYLRALTTDTDERFLTFVDSRKQTEQIATILGRGAGDAPDEDGASEEGVALGEHHTPLDSARVLPYRSGYEERDRAAIQRRLSDGSLQGVVSTSALELGMDIPHLDTVVLVGVPRSSTSLQQRIGRVGRTRPGRVLVMHSGDLLDEAVFAAPEKLLDRPPAEGALYLANPYIQYIHALCLARAGGEHEQAGGSSDPDVEFTSPVPWPEGFMELCQAERIGQIPAELQPMKSEAGDTPHYTFPLRDVEPQFQIEQSQGPIRHGRGSVSYSQALRETYPGAIYYYTAQPYRVLSISPGTRKVVVRPDRHYHTQPTRMTTCVFPNLSPGNVFSALEYAGTLRAVECNLQIREAVIGLKERRGSAETSYTYPLIGLPSGVMYSQPRFTRNYFTTGVLLTHPALLVDGVMEEVMTLVFEALLIVAPYERQDLGSAVDHIRASNDIVPQGTQFAAVHDQTYGSLRLSGRLMDPEVLRTVVQAAYQLALAAEVGYAPPVLNALRAIAEAAEPAPRPLALSDVIIPAEFADLPRVVMPGSKGLNVARGNAEFEVQRVVYNPRMGGIAYVGHHLTSRPVVAQTETVRYDALVEIPGESVIGYYDYDTAEVRVASA